MSYLFLDDERKPSQVTWVVLPDVIFDVVRNYQQFVQYIEHNGLPEFVSFDHDLGAFHYETLMKISNESNISVFLDEINRTNSPVEIDYGTEKTGYDCAKWLVEYCFDHGLKFPEYEVHSMNPIGALNIRTYIENAKKNGI